MQINDITGAVIQLEIGFRVDLMVNRAVLVELKSTEVVAPAHKKTLLTYLRIADRRIGLLINFGEEVLKKGIHRIANNYADQNVLADAGRKLPR